MAGHDMSCRDIVDDLSSKKVCAGGQGPGFGLGGSSDVAGIPPDGREIVDQDLAVDDRRPDEGEWRPFRHGWQVLPQDADTDGMVVIRYRRTP